MLKRAECSRCNARLPLDCGFFEFKFAPRELTCWQCGARMPAPFAYRSNWLGFQFFRGAFILCTLFGLSLAFFTPEKFIGMAIFGTVFGAMVGMVVGTVGAGLLGPLLQVVLDLFHGMKKLDPDNANDDAEQASEAPDPTALQHPATQQSQRRKAG